MGLMFRRFRLYLACMLRRALERATWQMEWYLARFRMMDGAEVLHRIVEQGFVIGVWARYRLGAFPKQLDWEVLRFCNASEFQIPPLRFSSGLLACDQFEICEWPALGFSWAWSDIEDVWHRAPDTRKVWPRTFFGWIPFRHGNPFGDARVVWEPSRLQQLVWLARLAQEAQRETSEAAIELARAQLVSWVRNNPPWTGVHYVSGIECALRFIAVCHALDMLREHFSLDDPVWKHLTAIVASHPAFIAKRISRYSSSGNHTIAEAAALVYAGVLFPELKGATVWAEDGLNTLCAETERQVLPDGGGIEQSLYYHKSVLELIALVERLLRYRGIPVPTQLCAAIDRGAIFLSRMGDVGGRLPSIGDSDSGCSLSPDLAILPCDRPAGSYVKEFENSGYTVIHCDSPNSVHLILDHGPFGMPPAYGHAHCDALALLMSVDGVPQLLDPGTYTYTGEKHWRAYFRSARAHNTVTVNGRDSAKQESAFQWSGTFRASLVEKEGAEGGPLRLLACHKGYHQNGITHWRYVGVFGRPVVVVVMDVLLGPGEHDLELNWHMPAEVSAGNDDVFRLKRLSASVSGGKSTLVLGDASQDPRAWWSPVYGRLEPAACLTTHYQGALPHEFVSIFYQSDAILDRNAIDRELTQGREWIAKHQTG
jgi:uncharacterized heparinase superfamily protein